MALLKEPRARRRVNPTAPGDVWFGTFETCRWTVKMPAYRGRTEVNGAGQNDANDPKRICPARHRCCANWPSRPIPLLLAFSCCNRSGSRPGFNVMLASTHFSWNMSRVLVHACKETAERRTKKKVSSPLLQRPPYHLALISGTRGEGI